MPVCRLCKKNCTCLPLPFPTSNVFLVSFWNRCNSLAGIRFWYGCLFVWLLAWCRHNIALKRSASYLCAAHANFAARNDARNASIILLIRSFLCRVICSKRKENINHDFLEYICCPISSLQTFGKRSSECTSNVLCGIQFGFNTWRIVVVFIVKSVDLLRLLFDLVLLTPVCSYWFTDF